MSRHHDTSVHDPGVEVGPDQLQESFVGYVFGQLGHELVVVYPVEERFDIEVYHPLTALFDIASGLSHRVCGLPARPVAIASFREGRFQNRREDLEQHLAYEPVECCGDTERSGSPAGFGDVGCSYRLRFVASGQQRRPNLVPLAVEVFGQLFGRHGIDAR